MTKQEEIYLATDVAKRVAIMPGVKADTVPVPVYVEIEGEVLSGAQYVDGVGNHCIYVVGDVPPIYKTGRPRLYKTHDNHEWFISWYGSSDIVDQNEFKEYYYPFGVAFGLHLLGSTGTEHRKWQRKPLVISVVENL
jgi:hypothetical protein